MRYTSAMRGCGSQRAGLLLVVLLLSFAEFGTGQDFWQKKPYQDWSAQECHRLLYDSPWAQVFTLVKVETPATEKHDDIEQAGESLPDLSYVAQIRSALPVRQALVRQLELSGEHSQSSPAEKQAVAEQTQRFLSAAFTDTVSIYVSYSSNVLVYNGDLVRFWEAQDTATLRNQVFLIRGSDRIKIIGFQPAPHGQNGFTLVFPRKVQGRALLSPSDKRLTLSIELLHPSARQPIRPVTFEFKPKKMVYEGQLTY